jgi:hypothetical protein
MNALKEGLFSQYLVIADADRPAHDALRDDILAQFKPRTPMQVLAVNGIASTAWRYSQAIRRQARLLNAELLAVEAPAAAPPPPSRFEWFGANRHAARRAQDLARQAQAEIEEAGRINPATEQSLQLAFGDDFVSALNDWKTSEHTAMMMISSWRKKHELYGTALPEADRSVGCTGDPKERMHMQQKLLTQQCDFLMQVERILARSDEAEGMRTSPDLGHRYVTGTFKEFMSAVLFYDQIRELGM